MAPTTRLAHIAKLGVQSDDRQQALAKLDDPAAAAAAAEEEVEKGKGKKLKSIDFDNVDPATQVLPGGWCSQ